MNKQLIEKILDKAKTARIAVVGDFCLDVYWFLNESASEKSLETGLPTWPIDEQNFSLGGAGNVVANIQSLGCENIQAYGIIGQRSLGTSTKAKPKSTRCQLCWTNDTGEKLGNTYLCKAL